MSEIQSQVGDVVRMNGVPPGIADVTVTGVSICGDRGCPEVTITFEDPGTGESDEAHAADFTLVRKVVT